MFWRTGTVQFSSVSQLCLTLWDPLDCNMPGFPVHNKLPKFTQTHVHRVSDAIKPSHPLSSPFPPAFNLSQHQGLLKWVSSLHQVAKILKFQLQHQSFQWTPRADLLQNGLVGFPCSPRDSQESFPTPQFNSIKSTLLKLYILIRSHLFILLLFPIFWEVGHRGSCCDLCRRAFCLCSPPAVL